MPVGGREDAKKALKRGARIMQGEDDQDVVVKGYRQMKEMFKDLNS